MTERSKKLLRILAGVSLVLGVVWRVFLAGQFLKIPNDFTYTAEINSQDNFYDAEKGAYKGPQYSVTQFSYQVVDIQKEGLVIKNSFDVRTPEGEPIFSTEHLYGVDPYTGAHVAGLGDEDREGYLFAPQNLQEGQSFTYWHVNYDAPATMEFVDKEELYGLAVFHYQSDYGGVPVDQSKELSHLLDPTKNVGIHVYPHLELWLEPTTGRLVSYQDDTNAYFYDTLTGEDLTPWNHFSNQFSEASIEAHAKEAQRQKALSFIFKDMILLDVSAFALILFVVSTWRKATPIEEKARVPVVVSLFVTFVPIIGTLTASSLLYENVSNQLQMKFNTSAQQVEDAITKRVDSYITVLQGTQGLFAASQDVSREEWEVYVDQLDLLKNYPGASGVGFIKVVTEAEKATYNAAVTAEGYPEASIRPEGERGVYAPVKYIKLVDSTYKAADFLGFDMYSEAIRDQAILEARDTSAPSVSGKAKLMSEDNDKVGFYIYIPIYEKDAPHSTPQEREANIFGYTYSRFRVSTLMQGIFGDSALPLYFQIYDGTTINKNNLLYDSTTEGANAKTDGDYSKTEVVYLAGHPWTFHFTSNDHLNLDSNQKGIFYGFLIVGTVSSLLIVLFYYSLLLSRKQLLEDYLKRKMR